MKIAILLIAAMMVISGVFLYVIEIKPRQVKAECWKEAYAQRPHENDFEWTQGKKWMPKPGNEVTASDSYVWIYPDQSDTTQEGIDAKAARNAAQKSSYENCIKGQGY